MRLGKQGFSLTELAVAIGIAGVSALAITDLVTSAHRSKTVVEQALSLDQAMNDVMMVFNDPENCSKVFGKGNAFPGSLAVANVFNPNIPPVADPSLATNADKQRVFMNKGIGSGLNCVIPSTGLPPPNPPGLGCMDPQVFARATDPKWYQSFPGATTVGARQQNYLTNGYIIRDMYFLTVPDGKIGALLTGYNYGTPPPAGRVGEQVATVNIQKARALFVIEAENTFVSDRSGRSGGTPIVYRRIPVIVQTEFRTAPVAGPNWVISGCANTAAGQTVSGMSDPTPGLAGCVNVPPPPGGGFTYCPAGTYSLYQRTLFGGGPVCWPCGKGGLCCGGSATASSSLTCCPVAE